MNVLSWAGKRYKDSNRLDFTFPVKCIKAKEEGGKKIVVLEASDTGIDFHQERFTELAVNSMADYAKTGVELIRTHYDPFAIGKTITGNVEYVGEDDLTSIPIYKFVAEAELDMRYIEAKILFDDVLTGKNERQLSVGGFILWDEPDAILWEEIEIPVDEDQKTKTTIYVLAINKFYLEHIAITRKDSAANPRTGFVSAITRSIDHDWMVRNNIKPPYDDINKAICKGGVCYKFNLGWLDISKNRVIKTANGYKHFPLAPEDTKWKFSVSDANEILGDGEKKDWKTYQKVHFWYDPENKEKKSGYKLPFAKYIDVDDERKIMAVWKGVASAMAALLGARGGVDIPDDDRKKVYNNISYYYKRFDKEPPEFKVYNSFDEFADIEAHKSIKDYLVTMKSYFEEESEMAKSNDSLRDQAIKAAKEESERRLKGKVEDEEEVVEKTETKPAEETKTETKKAEEKPTETKEKKTETKAKDETEDKKDETEEKEVTKTEDKGEEETKEEPQTDTKKTKTEETPDPMKTIMKSIDDISKTIEKRFKEIGEAFDESKKNIESLTNRIAEVESRIDDTKNKGLEDSSLVIKDNSEEDIGISGLFIDF